MESFQNGKTKYKSVAPLDRHYCEREFQYCNFDSSDDPKGHVGGKTNTILFRRICIKIKFSSQRRDRLLFLIDHQHGRHDVTCNHAIGSFLSSKEVS